nr:uncharacterized protein LOC109173561 [Ipomoea batatas]
MAPERGNKPNYLDNNPMERMMNGDTDGGGNAGKLKEAKAQSNQTGPPPVCENATVTGPTNKNMGATQFKAPVIDNGKGKNVQAGRAQQGNQWSMGNLANTFRANDSSVFRGKTGAEGAPNAGKAKDQGGAVPRQQQTVNQEGPQGQNFQRRGNGGKWGGTEKADMDPGDGIGSRAAGNRAKRKFWKMEKDVEEGQVESDSTSDEDYGESGEESEDEGEAKEMENELEERRKRRMKWENVIVESDLEVYIEGGIVRLFQNGVVVASTCKPKVNCLAKALADRSEGQNVIYGTVGSLPSGFQQLLSLEGIPHFGWVPGRDWA